jgi:hypothetical protein
MSNFPLTFVPRLEASNAHYFYIKIYNFMQVFRTYSDITIDTVQVKQAPMAGESVSRPVNVPPGSEDAFTRLIKAPLPSPRSPSSGLELPLFKPEGGSFKLKGNCLSVKQHSLTPVIKQIKFHYIIN